MQKNKNNCTARHYTLAAQLNCFTCFPALNPVDRECDGHYNAAARLDCPICTTATADHTAYSLASAASTHTPRRYREDPSRPLNSSFLDLSDYGSGIVPGDNDDRHREQQEDELLWHSHRDDVELWIESKKRGEGELTHVTGANYAPGAAGGKEWLDEQEAQDRITYSELLDAARRRWARRLPKSFAGSIHNDPQLLLLRRRVEARRYRFNVRRYLEALGYDPDSRPFFLVGAPTWRMREAACRRVDRHLRQRALLGVPVADREYQHPTGLIATSVRRKAA